MWRSVASNGFTILIVLALLLGGTILWGKREYVAEGPLDEAVCIRVDSGESMESVTKALAEKGAVTLPKLMRVGADYTHKTPDLKAGSWLVPARSSMEQIVDIITRGGASTCGTEILFRVGVRNSDVLVRDLDPKSGKFEEEARFDTSDKTVPDAYTRTIAEPDTRFRVAMAEGVTSWQVAQVLNKMDVLSGDAVKAPAEGSLAPDSYEFKRGDSRTSLIDRMQARQKKILDEAWAGRADDLPLKSPEEALIMASIIEKETGLPDERRLVASVFENRLKKGMRLQTDPTVIYGITKGEGVLDRGLRQSELNRKTPYNTYQIDGLPPTPIANPGRASIEAAVHPAVSNYIYFVADGSGGHAFASTLAEHNANVAKWRRLQAEQKKDASDQ